MIFQRLDKAKLTRGLWLRNQKKSVDHHQDQNSLGRGKRQGVNFEVNFMMNGLVARKSRSSVFERLSVRWWSSIHEDMSERELCLIAGEITVHEQGGRLGLKLGDSCHGSVGKYGLVSCGVLFI